MLWGGVRRWLGPNAIAGGLVSYQQFDRLVDLALLARIEFATRTDRERLMLLLPLAVEVQFRTGGGRVAPSTAVVLALAL